ncbi:MAG: hypothetical protein R3D44_13210 [Hyphomicrobiaceae bacterium]
MTEVSISVLRDTETGGEGRALLRLTGVALLPPGSTFRIEPLDMDETTPPPAGWPIGELKPQAQRITSDGVDLVIGAEVVQAEALLPGTPVKITVPAIGAKAELRWPNLPVIKPARRSAVVLTGEQRAAELAAKAVAEAANNAAARERMEADAKAQAEEQARRATAPIAAPAPKSAFEALSSLTPSREKPASTEGNSAAAFPPVEALSGLKVPPKSAAETAAHPASTKSPVAVPPQAAILKPAKLTASAPPPAKPATSSPQTSIGPARVAPVTHSAGSAASPPVERRSIWPIATVAFALGGLIAGALFLAIPRISPDPGTLRLAATTPRSVTPPSGDRTGAFAAPRLAAILAVPATSPLGHSSAGVSLDEALKRADRSLYDPTAKDRKEAKFWLRKALSLGLGDSRLLWALSQLGTLYASPDTEAPDYASARILWELAAAKGDPMALCFLASLAENGLGGPRSTSEALSLLEQAKARGGCRGVDQDIDRLRKSTQ